MPDHSVVYIKPYLKASQFVGAPGVCGSRLTTKLFRRWCSPPRPVPLILPPHSPPPTLRILWLDFWDLPLTHSCRNIWYRYLHKKIPRRSLLYRFIPDYFPSAAYLICSHSTECIDHFLLCVLSNLLFGKLVR